MGFSKKDIMKSGRNQLTFQEQIELGVDALQHGLSRSVMLDGRTNWDTHANNHVQGDYFNDLFIALDSLALEISPLLADEILGEITASDDMRRGGGLAKDRTDIIFKANLHFIFY